MITATLLALGTGTAGATVLVYNNWSGNLDSKDLSSQLKDRPENEEVAGPQEPLDILVMGSDTREGAGNNIDGLVGDGERSDTTILLHLSADRQDAYGISIPRDTLVDRPTCYEEDGVTEIPGAENAMWNEAFSLGGPACTIQQFEQLTDIRVDNYLVIDFQGFRDMVNALGGVEVCIPEEIDDDKANIHLEAGTRELKGDEALGYVRVRNVGDGTDPNRIRRQQAFMAAMINKAVSAGMLTRLDRLVGFVNAVTDSITTDYEDPQDLVSLGRSFQGVGLDNVRFVTTPWQYSTIDPNRVEWLPEVGKLWRLVRKDRPLTEQFTDESISAAERPDGSEPPRGEASDPSGTDDPNGTDDPSATDGTDGTDGSDTGTDDTDDGLSDEARERAGLC
ncbi:LCP family protein [Nocardioides sp. TF02-7]|uniref:LCP family protein n=1 Tax=Nocardioides sp. TF02-7 TaxID=2917724 RepID=UPI001F06262F|nr:LCP family protein [Nocardioides sp. TF02-7]UMG93733.1 LCP family protein [Nocardioides sp. TF02-7]